MVDLGGSVGSLTWVVEIIAKSSGFKRYRGKKKKHQKQSRQSHVHQNALSREEKTRAQRKTEGIRTD